jgi:hypothetical protein
MRRLCARKFREAWAASTSGGPVHPSRRRRVRAKEMPANGQDPFRRFVRRRSASIPVFGDRGGPVVVET